MIREPLFVRFINGQITSDEILDAFSNGTEDEFSKEIIVEKKDDLPDLSQFRRDFSNAVKDLIDNGINHYFTDYVNSYMKPSLEEFVEETGFQNTGMEKRWVRIKDKDAPWPEALICYNLCLYVKAFSFNTIKNCKTCQKVFTHKGKYASYCSETCKSVKTGQLTKSETNQGIS